MSDKERVSGEEVERFDVTEGGGTFKCPGGELVYYSDFKRVTEALQGEVERLTANVEAANASILGLQALVNDEVDKNEAISAERDQLRAEVERLTQEKDHTYSVAIGRGLEIANLKAQLAQQQEVPEGYVLVPVDLPEPMLQAAYDLYHTDEWGNAGDDEIARLFWRTLLAAAPAPVQQPAVCMGCVEQASRIRELEHKMDYYTSAPVVEPASPWEVIADRIEEAFQFGFNAPVTYNDVLENDVSEAWQKEKDYLLRPLSPAPEVV